MANPAQKLSNESAFRFRATILLYKTASRISVTTIIGIIDFFESIFIEHSDLKWVLIIVQTVFGHCIRYSRQETPLNNDKKIDSTGNDVQFWRVLILCHIPRHR